MDSDNTTFNERTDSLGATLIVSCGGEEAFRDLARSGEEWRESDADSARFQRYEASRKQSARRKEQSASR
jgi:hypothetical protein